MSAEYHFQLFAKTNLLYTARSFCNSRATC